jgi:transposase
MVCDIPPVRTPSRRRRCRPGKLDADKGYDSTANRAWLRRRGITTRIARRGIESSQRLGRHRWKVERALSWLSCYRRLAVRWDRDSERFFAFVLLACALVCFNRLYLKVRMAADPCTAPGLEGPFRVRLADEAVGEVALLLGCHGGCAALPEPCGLTGRPHPAWRRHSASSRRHAPRVLEPHGGYISVGQPVPQQASRAATTGSLSQLDAVLLDVLGSSDSQCHRWRLRRSGWEPGRRRLRPAPLGAYLPGHRVAAQELLVEVAQAWEAIAQGREPGS